MSAADLTAAGLQLILQAASSPDLTLAQAQVELCRATLLRFCDDPSAVSLPQIAEVLKGLAETETQGVDHLAALKDFWGEMRKGEAG
jgi:hypothetical protein